MKSAQETKKHTLVLTVGVLFTSWLMVYMFLEYQFTSTVNEKFINAYKSTEKLFWLNKGHERRTFELELEKIVGLNGLSKAVAYTNKDSLAKLIDQYYLDLRMMYPDIRLLTFRSNKNITLYRAHKPEYFGDTTNKKRKLIYDTNKLQKSLSGFEVGKLDMTYRVTQPIFYDGKYVGNVELGLEPTHFIKDLTTVFPIEIGIAIDKELLSIMLEEETIKINDRYVFLRGDEVIKNYFLKENHTFNENQIYTDSLTNNDTLKINMSIKLENHINEQLGYLIVAFDASDIIQNKYILMQKLFTFIAVMMLLLGMVLLQGFNSLLRKFQENVYLDHLTGLNNLTSFNNNVEVSKKHSVILSNVKGFSILNEYYGLDIGNEILIRVAEVFKDFAKAHGFEVYRVSGDEFALTKIREFFDTDDCHALVDELHYQVKHLKIHIIGVEDVISVEIYSGIANENFNLLANAHMALKIAKERSLPYLKYTENVSTKKRSELTIRMKKSIRYALDNNNVVPYFQAICDKHGNIIKYEALARILEYEDGHKHVIMPDVFLSIAMKNMMYIDIAKDILRQSLSAFVDRKEKISINMLPNDFFNSEIMDLLLNAIKEFKDPKRIVIEITEQEGVEDFIRLLEVIKMLKKLGVLIAIDDFGSGYANYAHILKIKPDYLKIDGSLVKNILTDHESQILVKSIVSFAKSLNILTIAEYVENKEIVDLLGEYGVDEYQGYYFSKPSELEE